MPLPSYHLFLSFISPRSFTEESAVTEAYCSSLLKDLKLDGIPQECHSFASFREAKLKTKEEVNPFAGMNAGQALGAQSARAGGRLNQAQIMRRMSSRARPKDKSWF